MDPESPLTPVKYVGSVIWVLYLNASVKHRLWKDRVYIYIYWLRPSPSNSHHGANHKKSTTVFGVNHPKTRIINSPGPLTMNPKILPQTVTPRFLRSTVSSFKLIRPLARSLRPYECNPVPRPETSKAHYNSNRRKSAPEHYTQTQNSKPASTSVAQVLFEEVLHARARYFCPQRNGFGVWAHVTTSAEHASCSLLQQPWLSRQQHPVSAHPTN